MTAPVPEYDEDGYPTDASLAAIESFVGTPEALVEFATALFDGGYVKVEDAVGSFGRAVKRVTFIPCGWSGAESVVGALSYRTGFHLHFWHSSYRGGMEIYEIPVSLWQTESFLARYDLPQPDTSPDTTSPSATDQKENTHV